MDYILIVYVYQISNRYIISNIDLSVYISILHVKYKISQCMRTSLAEIPSKQNAMRSFSTVKTTMKYFIQACDTMPRPKSMMFLIEKMELKLLSFLHFLYTNTEKVLV